MPSPAEYREQATFDRRMAGRDALRTLVARWRETARWEADQSRTAPLGDAAFKLGKAGAYTVAADELSIALQQLC